MMKEKIKNVIGEMLVVGYVTEAVRINPFASKEYRIILTKNGKIFSKLRNKESNNMNLIAEYRNAKGIDSKELDVYCFKIIAGDYATE